MVSLLSESDILAICDKLLAKASAVSSMSTPFLSLMIHLLLYVFVAMQYSPDKIYSYVFVGGWCW